LPILQRLADARIQVHAQIVLVPEYNDEETLLQTITDLANLHPANRGTFGGVLSVAVVPIGITQFRERLAPVKTVNAQQASDVLDTLGALREDYLKRLGTRFVYPSDEFYLMTNRDIPSRPEYEGFPQLEDGVGLVRLFLDSLNRVRATMPKAIAKPASFTFVTGELAAPLLRTLAATLSEIDGVTVNVCAVHNWFFEGNINIAGLIVGGDIVRAMETFDVNETVVIPSVMLRDGEEVFLDEMTVDQLEEKLGRRVMVIERTPEAALDAVVNPGQLRRHVRDGNV
jgi:putative radical SAM enzyme (TIGR03279 family)